LRRDFWYWLRLEGGASLATAVIERTLVKVVADFTGCVHFRHPFEMGGGGLQPFDGLGADHALPGVELVLEGEQGGPAVAAGGEFHRLGGAERFLLPVD